MGYNFNYEFGNKNNDDSRDGKLSDLVGGRFGYSQNNANVRQYDFNNSLSDLVAPQSSEHQFFDPYQSRSVAGGLAMRASPDSTAEFYVGDNKDQYIQDYMSRMGFGNTIRAYYNSK